ncbi:hypothetical protein ACFQ6B_23655 [Streptomyces wedmorensis]|uniref:DNA-binding phage zinc finger domain-containing protein n=1 Tax=Streptomyces wedmorensis TaxID=43759 RepID=A0ABW6J6F6_STRWE
MSAATSLPGDTPALALPALAVACPTCNSPAGALCTSHSGTRPRRADVHQARTRAHQEQTR